VNVRHPLAPKNGNARTAPSLRLAVRVFFSFAAVVVRRCRLRLMLDGSEVCVGIN